MEGNNKGKLVIIAPVTKGTNSTVDLGNFDFVKWAKMILVAILPNTIPVVMANKMKWRCDNIVE
jgi:hypothetical protein